MNKNKKTISIVIPAYNEEAGVLPMYRELKNVLKKISNYNHEIIFVNDGSADNTASAIRDIIKGDNAVKLIDFSRNFGKELATSAGLHHSKGDAVMCIDCDLQHPPEHIPEFIRKWEDGYDVVVGVRKNNASDSLFKKLGSHMYYKILRKLTKIEITPKATDYRLIDRQVVEHFKTFTEHSRMTRGLIDWLGFDRAYVYFDVPERLYGQASYNISKLISLAMQSFISYSFVPLRLAGYLGSVIVVLSMFLGTFMFLDRYIIDSWDYNFSGPAMLAVLLLFLVGVILLCIAVLSFYIEHIYHDVQNRHLYIIKKPRE